MRHAPVLIAVLLLFPGCTLLEKPPSEKTYLGQYEYYAAVYSALVEEECADFESEDYSSALEMHFQAKAHFSKAQDSFDSFCDYIFSNPDLYSEYEAEDALRICSAGRNQLQSCQQGMLSFMESAIRFKQKNTHETCIRMAEDFDSAERNCRNAHASYEDILGKWEPMGDPGQFDHMCSKLE
jgi:hypothetical protein